MNRIKIALVTLASALTLAAVPAVASADIVRYGGQFAETTNPCSCVTTIDGYLFTGMPYYDASPEVDSAVELWLEVSADPNYQPLKPITSISTTAEVGGTVEGDDSNDEFDRSSWGR